MPTLRRHRMLEERAKRSGFDTANAYSVDRRVKSQRVAAIELAMLESAQTGKPLQQVLEEHRLR